MAGCRAACSPSAGRRSRRHIRKCSDRWLRLRLCRRHRRRPSAPLLGLRAGWTERAVSAGGGLQLAAIRSRPDLLLHPPLSLPESLSWPLRSVSSLVVSFASLSLPSFSLFSLCRRPGVAAARTPITTRVSCSSACCRPLCPFPFASHLIARIRLLLLARGSCAVGSGPIASVSPSHISHTHAELAIDRKLQLDRGIQARGQLLALRSSCAAASL